MERTCAVSGKSFTIRPEDLAFYEKIGVPPPTLCPDERSRRRFAFRNERTLYEGTCDLCEKAIISIYSPEKPYTVYCHECWWGDRWDIEDYGVKFDFNLPFFEQFNELLLKVPRASIYNIEPENSDYCQQVMYNKNCYLSSVAKNCEDCRYLSYAIDSKDSLDCMLIHESELCYECVDIRNCYNCFYSSNCNNSNNLYFSYDCNGCNDCFGCFGLRNKQYHIANKPYSKEEYFEKLKSFGLGKHSTETRLSEEFKRFRLQHPHRAAWNINIENSTGNKIQNAKNAHHCFDVFDIEDCGYCTWIFRMKDSYDCYGVGDSELIYEGIGVDEVTRCYFNTFTTGSNEVHYSDSCFSSRDLFGCVGVRKGQYMIFNKKYSEQEYEALKAKLIDHMKTTCEFGEFFPISISPFGYNETLAQEKFSIDKKKADQRGWKWQTKNPKEYQSQTYQPADDIHDEKDEIVEALLACEDCGRNYRVLQQDLAFYRKHSLPVPRHCVPCRHQKRVDMRMPYRLHQRICAKCSAEIYTPYSEKAPETVYCEKCYLKEMY